MPIQRQNARPTIGKKLFTHYIESGWSGWPIDHICKSFAIRRQLTLIFYSCNLRGSPLGQSSKDSYIFDPVPFLCQHRCGNSAEPILTLLCPNGTLYNQQYFVCDWWFNVDCSVVSIEQYSFEKYLFTSHLHPGTGLVLHQRRLQRGSCRQH